MSRPESTPAPTERLAADLLARTREELVRADQKASILFASTGIVVGALMAGALAGKWTPFALPNSIEWAWWLGAAAGLGGIYRAASAVYPRTRRKGEFEGVAYFADVVRVGRQELENELAKTVRKARTPIADQLYQNSWIVDRKYVNIQRSLQLMGIAALLTIGSTLVGALVS